ncbi:MAG: DUF4097 family beta strand repeat protein [Actinobacteria bacterium]|nr:DUF4097 family beta strand repeat protein [Actinomycetota bacterium]
MENAQRSARRPIALLVSMLAAVIAATGLAACAVSVGALEHRTTTYSVPEPVRTLVVAAQVGNVQVTGGPKATVSVTERSTFHATAPTTTHRARDGTLTLTNKCPVAETCKVDYTINVPRATTVRISDGAGAVRIGSITSSVSVKVNAGNIVLDSLAGPVDATDHAGSITGNRLSSGKETLRVSAGRVDATFAAPPAAINATTDVGAITIRVPKSVPYDVKASATVGKVTVAVPRSIASTHTIKVSTKTGAITISPAP